MKSISTVSFAILVVLLSFGCGRRDVVIVGTLERTRIELAAPISEAIARIDVREGQLVKKGDVLLQLDPVITQAQYDAAAAQAKLAKLDLGRAEPLVKTNVISVEEYDRIFHTSVEKTAHADELKARLDQLTIRAPVDGVVDELPFELGERPKVGNIVAVVLSGELPFARVYVPEEDAPHVHPGSEAKVLVEGLDGWREARVRKISQSASFTPHFALTDREKSRLVFEAEVDIVDPEVKNLRVGVPLKTKLILQP